MHISKLSASEIWKKLIVTAEADLYVVLLTWEIRNVVISFHPIPIKSLPCFVPFPWN